MVVEQRPVPDEERCGGKSPQPDGNEKPRPGATCEPRSGTREGDHGEHRSRMKQLGDLLGVLSQAALERARVGMKRDRVLIESAERAGIGDEQRQRHRGAAEQEAAEDSPGWSERDEQSRGGHERRHREELHGN